MQRSVSIGAVSPFRRRIVGSPWSGRDGSRRRMAEKSIRLKRDGGPIPALRRGRPKMRRQLSEPAKPSEVSRDSSAPTSPSDKASSPEGPASSPNDDDALEGRVYSAKSTTSLRSQTSWDPAAQQNNNSWNPEPATFFQSLLQGTSETLRNLTDPGRESALAAVHRQIKSRNRILDSYMKLKNALREMQDEYVASKDHNNVIVRYQMMKKMVREVTVYERQYWMLLEVPAKQLSESPETYVQRVMNALEDRIAATPAPSAPAPKPKGGLASLLGSSAAIANQAREAQMLEKLKNKSAAELTKESAQIQTDMVKLIKKYHGLRGLVAQLHQAFEASKHYPIVPRYSFLKEMIKSVLRAPAFAEICHEVDE